MFKSLEKIDINQLNQLVDLRIDEGISIDFKTHFPEKTQDGKGIDEEWVRLFKVICAFANTKGGMIFVGVNEANGVASRVEGIDVENWERLRQNLIFKINNSFENSLQGFEFKQVRLSSGKSVIILNIPFSFKGPHRVRLREGEHIFVKRVEANNLEMTMDEIRDGFLKRETWTAKAENFKMQRIESLLSNDVKGPLSLTPPAIFMHLIPIGPRPTTLNFKNKSTRHALVNSIKSFNHENQPFFLSPEQLCFDGMFFLHESYPPHKQHLLITTAGQIEFAGYCGSYDTSIINLTEWETLSLEGIAHGIKFLLHEDVNPPYLLFCSIVGVRNRRILTSFMYQLATPNTLPRDRYDLPPIEIDEIQGECSKIKERLKELFQPSFDLVWNDLNIEHSPGPPISPPNLFMINAYK